MATVEGWFMGLAFPVVMIDMKKILYKFDNNNYIYVEPWEGLFKLSDLEIGTIYRYAYTMKQFAMLAIRYIAKQLNLRNCDISISTSDIEIERD